MKKLLVALLFLPSIAGAAWVSTNGSTVTATIEDGVGNKITSTSNALDMNIKSGSIGNTGFNVTGSLPAGAASIGTVVVSSMGVIDISGNSKSVGYASQNSSVPVNVLNTVGITGSISNTGFNVNNSPTVLPGNTANTTPWLMTSSITVTDISGVNRTLGYASMNSSAPVNVLNTLTVNTHAVTQSGAWTIGNLNGVVISSYAATVGPMENLVMIASANVLTGNGTTGTGSQRVTIASDNTAFTVIDGSMGVVGIDGVSRGAGYASQSSSIPVNAQGPIPVGTAVAGNPVYAGVYVASSTFPTLRTNGQGQYLLADPAGRTITVGGVPSWMVKTATITLTGTTPITLIASAAASNFNDLCGCIGTNTSATNTYVMFQSTGAAGGGWPAADFPLGMPANDVPVGFGPVSCEHPVPQRAAASNWEVQAANAVTDLRITCYYYTIAR